MLGWDAEAQLLDSARVEADQLASGCCGLAGNFGFEPGHRAVSEACAERVLLPAVRNAPDDTVILADGFSCRTQIHELDSGGREAVHLAELLCAAIDGASPARGRGGPAPAEAAHPEDALAIRPTVLHQAGGLTRRRGPALSMRSRAPAR